MTPLLWVTAALTGALTTARAAEPVEVRCAREVGFTTPYRWSYRAEGGTILAATALVVRADPERLRPRDVGQPLLYADGWPVEVLRVEGDRALVLSPVVPRRVYLGAAALPERVDAPRRAAMESEAAVAAARDEASWAPRVDALLQAHPERLEVTPGVAPRRAMITALEAWMATCEGP